MKVLTYILWIATLMVSVLLVQNLIQESDSRTQELELLEENVQSWDTPLQVAEQRLERRLDYVHTTLRENGNRMQDVWVQNMLTQVLSEVDSFYQTDKREAHFVNAIKPDSIWENIKPKVTDILEQELIEVPASLESLGCPISNWHELHTKLILAQEYSYEVGYGCCFCIKNPFVVYPTKSLFNVGDTAEFLVALHESRYPRYWMPKVNSSLGRVRLDKYGFGTLSKKVPATGQPIQIDYEIKVRDSVVLAGSKEVTYEMID